MSIQSRTFAPTPFARTSHMVPASLKSTAGMCISQQQTQAFGDPQADTSQGERQTETE